MIKIKGHIKEGLEISQWPKDQGLVHDKDYVWYCKSADNVVVIDIKEGVWGTCKLETAIALK